MAATPSLPVLRLPARGFDPNLFANMRAGDFTYVIFFLPKPNTASGMRSEADETSRLFSVSATGRLFRDIAPAPDSHLLPA
jgi:hypothetical protein